MSIAATAHPIIASYVCPALGLVLCGSGLYGILKPDAAARTLFGVHTLKSEDLVFYPGLAARNLSVGLATFALIRTGEYRALGWVFLTWANTGLWDIYMVKRASPPVTDVWGHVVTIGILVVAGSGLAGFW